MAQPFSPAVLPGLIPLQLPVHGLAAPSPNSGQRWAATRFRRAFREGVWYQHLYLYAQTERDEALLEAMGHLDLSECLFASVIDQLAVLYQEEPVITNEADVSSWSDALDRLFACHQDLNGAALAYGEAALVLDLCDGEVTAILALPDEIDATPMTHGSRELGVFQRVTCREIPTPGGRLVETVCWDRWDVRDPNAPRFDVLRDGGKPIPDLTLEGSAYPWRYQDGRPFIPAVLYHGRRGHHLWSPYGWVELLWATLETAMSWSDWREAFKNASYALRYLLDGEIDGAAAQGDGGSASKTVPIVPNVLLKLRSSASQVASAGVLAAPIDILKHAEAIQLRHKLRAHAIGLHPSEIEAGGSAESGVALTIRREGQRREQRRQAPLFRRGDLELLRKWAACVRMATKGGEAPPEDGWSIDYPGIPETPAERADARAQEQHDLERGLRDRAQVLADREGIALDAAQQRIADMAARAAAQGGNVETFNGAQVTAAYQIMAGIKAGEITAEQGLSAFVRFFGLEQGDAGGLVGTLVAPSAPGAQPPPDDMPATRTQPPDVVAANQANTARALPLNAPPEPNRDPYPYAGQADVAGLHILVETAAGETRSGTDPDGNGWSVTMPWHYGEIEGTMGLDGEPVDVLIGPDPEATDVYVLHLRKPGLEGSDEDKVYLGFASEEEALAAFRAAYTRTDILQGLTRWPLKALVQVLLDENRRGIRLDAPPGSGLVEREPEPDAMDPAEAEEPDEPEEI